MSAPRRIRTIETRKTLGQRLELRDGLVRELLIRHAIRARIEKRVWRNEPECNLGGARDLGAHARAFLAQVDPHQLRADHRQIPDEARRTDQVGHRIRDRDVVDVCGLLRIRKSEPLNRLARGTDHGGFGERSGQQARGRADVIAEQLREAEGGAEARDADDHRERHLRARVAFESAKELRSDFVSRREEEQIEEDRLHERRDLDVELSNHDAGEEGAHDDAEAEAAELHASDQKPDRKREKNRELRIAS